MNAQFTSGVQALQEVIETTQKKSEGLRGGGGGLQYFNWKNGDKKVVRFLADDLITAYFYDFIVDNTGQTKNFMVPPDDPERLFRYMSPTPGVGWRRSPKSFALEEPKPIGAKEGNRAAPGAPRQMTVGMAVLRQEVPRDGKLVIEDFVYDREVEGATLPSRFFGVVQQSINNFWHTLAVSCYNRYGTLCDRDYEITREGESFDTKYSIIPLPEVPELTDIEMVKTFYGYGQPWDPKDPQRYLKCPMTTLEWATYFCGEERYQHWLTPTALGGVAPVRTPSGTDEFHPATTHNSADEAQASAPVVSAPSSSTSFATLSEQLIEAARNKGK